jgi:hypothetical protein
MKMLHFKEGGHMLPGKKMCIRSFGRVFFVNISWEMWAHMEG